MIYFILFSVIMVQKQNEQLLNEELIFIFRVFFISLTDLSPSMMTICH